MKNKITVSRVGAVLLGQTRLGVDIWASLHVEKDGRMVDLFAPNCARIYLHYIRDLTSSIDSMDTIYRTRFTIAEIATWDERIEGSTVEERYAFVYDVLLDETKALTLLQRVTDKEMEKINRQGLGQEAPHDRGLGGKNEFVP
jgi:hypothetical protein